jgi:hypothetical protein
LGFQGVLRVMLFVLRQQAIIVEYCRPVPQGVAVDHCVLLWIHYHPFKAEQRA